MTDMLKTLLFILTFALTLLFLSCTSTKISDHIRVYDNDSLIYHFAKDSGGNTLTYEDTIITRMLVRKGVIWKRFHENRDIFYFDTPNHLDTAGSDIFTDDIPLSKFTYYFEKGDLYMGDYVLRKENPMFGIMMKVIPKAIKVGQTYVYKSGDYKRTFTFLSTEEISWGKMSIKDALKFSMAFSSRQGLKTTDTIWLAKTWGLVKWKRLDGYTGQRRY